MRSRFLRLGIGGASGWAADIGVLTMWVIVFLFMGGMILWNIMKRE